MSSSEMIFKSWGGTPQLLEPKLWKSRVWGIKPHGADPNYSEVQISLESYVDSEGNLYRPEKGSDYSSLEDFKVVLKIYAAFLTEDIPVGMLEAACLPDFKAWIEWRQLAVGNLTLRKGKVGDFIVSNYCFFEGAEFHGTGSGRAAIIATSIEEVLGQLI